MKMRIRIDRIYGCFYHPVFNKYEVFARCYVNGGYCIRRLFFSTSEDAGAIEEGTWIDY